MEQLKSKKFNKKPFLLGICISLIVIVLLSYIIILNKGSSKGKIIVMNEAINDAEPLGGISIINLNNNRTELISKDGRYSYMDYSEIRNSIFAVADGETQIFEINLETKETVPVMLSLKNEIVRKYKYIKCVPNKNAISYSDNGNIFMYDFDTGVESILIKDDGEHSWNKKGRKILYVSSDDMRIHEYDLTLKKDLNLGIYGFAPQYSTDENYLVFFKREGNSAYTCVRRISDGYEWTYKENYVWEMHFNSDSSKLLMCEPNNFSVDQSIQRLVFWDFKNNKVKKLGIVYRSGSPFLFIN